MACLELVLTNASLALQTLNHSYKSDCSDPIAPVPKTCIKGQFASLLHLHAFYVFLCTHSLVFNSCVKQLVNLQEDTQQNGKERIL